MLVQLSSLSLIRVINVAGRHAAAISMEQRLLFNAYALDVIKYTA